MGEVLLNDHIDVFRTFDLLECFLSNLIKN